MTMSDDLGPMYGFEKFWQCAVYEGGIDKWMSRFKKEESLLVSGADLVSKLGGSDVVFWVPNFTFAHELDLPEFHGHCLYAREERDGNFVPTIEARKDPGSDCIRLYARKRFESGEVITLVSREEEEADILGLGGRFARISDTHAECNAYLTLHGALRSMREINVGDEIVRSKYSKKIDVYEWIGRLVLSPGGNRIGRINPHVVDGSVWIDYSDGTCEKMDSGAVYGYVIKGYGM